MGLVNIQSGKWQLRNHEGLTTSFFYGMPGDFPFAGAWDCDGVSSPGLYRRSTGYVYLRNSNTQGIADIKFFFGNPGDIPLAGDFDGDNCDTVSIYRPSEAKVYIINELGANDRGLGPAEFSYYFGIPGDKPFVGDFNDDDIDTIGLHRESTGLVYFRQTHTTGVADNQFFYGDPGDRLVAGDWGIVDGIDTPAIFRPSNSTFYFRHSNTQGVADSQFIYGSQAWLPVVGRFGLGSTFTASPLAAGSTTASGSVSTAECDDTDHRFRWRVTSLADDGSPLPIRNATSASGVMIDAPTPTLWRWRQPTVTNLFQVFANDMTVTVVDDDGSEHNVRRHIENFSTGNCDLLQWRPITGGDDGEFIFWRVRMMGCDVGPGGAGSPDVITQKIAFDAWTSDGTRLEHYGTSQSGWTDLRPHDSMLSFEYHAVFNDPQVTAAADPFPVTLRALVFVNGVGGVPQMQFLTMEGPTFETNICRLNSFTYGS